jgi:glycosyltransferase involved in cell wall biosynthesis
MKKPVVAIFRSNDISPDPRVEKIARTIANFSQVIVVGWDRSAQKVPVEYRDGYELHLFSYPASFGKGIANLISLLRWQLFLLVWVMVRGRSVKVYHACDFDTVLPAFVGKLFFKTPVVYDIFDFYADHIRNTPHWLVQIIRRLDLLAVRLSDVVIIVDEIRTTQLRGVSPKRLEIIYNTPEDRNLVPNQTSPAGKLRIAYIGILQIERGFLELIDVLENHPEWTLDLAGFGGDEEKILEKTNNIPWITWHGRVNYERALKLSAKADVLIATYDPKIPNHRLASPNKIFEAMMLGKSIIVAEGTHIDEMIKFWDCGLVVPYGDRSALEIALQKLADDIDLREQYGRNARRAYEEEYSWRIMEKRLLDIYGSF